MTKFRIPLLCLWGLLLFACCNADSESDSSNSASAEIASSSEDNGYIFTCPRSFKTTATNEMQLRRYGDLKAGTLIVKLLYTDSYSTNESVAIEKSFEIAEGASYTRLEIYLDKFDNYVYNGKIIINGTFGNHIIGGTDKIYYSTSKDNIVILQTDKPMYKKGQTVQFRVLGIDKDLKPVPDTKVDIWVEDPIGTRLFQWKDEDLGKGIKQYEFGLADEPVQGSWKIFASIKGENTETSFEVSEYVLPKFELEIKIPSYTLANTEEIPITVCAKYTYGKPVLGMLNMNVSLETYTWSTEKIPVLEHSQEIDGCIDYKINVSLIETDDYYRYRRIQIVGSVTELGTGVQRNETQYIQRTFSPLNLNFNQDQRQFYKPGLPYNGKLSCSHPDNTPAKGEGIQICYTVSRERILSDWWASKKVKFCKNYTSDDDGIIEYIIPPQSTDSVGISVEALSLKYVKKDKGTHRANSLSNPQTSMTLTPWYSPSGSFIQLQPVQETLFCGAKRSFKLLFTSKESAKFKFHYQVLSMGNVVQEGFVEQPFSTEDDVSKKFEDEEKLVNDREVQLVPPIDPSRPKIPDEECPSAREARYVPPVGEATFNLEVNPSWSPNFHLLVYYIRDDKETVADSQKFKVEKCFKNQVKLQFGDEVQQPATKTSIRVSASPNSLCGIKIVDKSVSLLNSDDQLTTEKLFNILESFDTGMYYGINHCNEDVPQPGLYAGGSSLRGDMIIPPRPWSSSSYEDSLAAFENTGLLVISDLTLFTRPCKSRGGNGNIVLAHDSVGYGGSAGSAYGGQAVAMASTARRPRPPAAAMPEAQNKIGVEATKSVVEVRNYFPETWLFRMEITGDDGEYLTKEKLPHTITEWVGSAACISAEDGLGISNKTSIKGFQAFFLSTDLPYSVKRGEQFTITMSVFSYVTEPLPITITVDKHEGFEGPGDSAPMVDNICLEPESSSNMKLMLKAKSLGQQNITIRAETAQDPSICKGAASVSKAIAKDAIESSLIVEAEGWKQEDVESMLFCPKNEADGTFKKTFSFTVPEDVIPDSQRGYLDFTGNVLGKSMDNLENLVVIPTGCGEQNMVKFAPNVVAMDVLIKTNQLTDKLKNRIEKNLYKGVQGQNKYKHSDGSYSAFGSRDKEGSMFLTAMVLRYFSEAAKYITIDNSTIVQMQNWIVSKQQADGCFPDVGKIIDRNIQGSLKKGDSQFPITAYVLASLYISGYQNETILESALNCIKKTDDDTFYATFLYAYVEALSGQDSAKERISAAKEKVTKKGGAEFYHDINATQSQDIETAAYAILSILTSGQGSSEALPIVQFLTQNMNRYGGFSSTQDTCVGLQALGEFAKLTFKDPVDIKVTTSGALQKEMTISEGEKLVVKREKVAEVPSEVELTAVGTGCALVQKIVRYNTRTPPEKRSFDLKVTGECADDSCKKGSISVTVSYLPPESKTGMAVVEVNMISGISPDRESLEKLLDDKDLKLMRFDVENNKCVFYFNEISNVPKHFEWDVEKVVNVENVQPGTATVYDYYHRDTASSSEYSFGKCEETNSCPKEP